MKSILLALVLLTAASSIDITQTSFGCTSYDSLASSNCTLALNYTSLNPILTVQLTSDFTNVSCTGCNITSSSGTTMKFNSTTVVKWAAVNPVVNGTYYILLSAVNSNGTALSMDNSELTVVVTPQQITASITSLNYTVGSYTSLTLNITASTTNGIASGSILQLNMPKNAINEVPYQAGYGCYNVHCSITQVTNGSSSNLGCTYSNILSNLDFNKTLPQATTLIFRLDNFRMPSSTEPYTIKGYLAYGTQGVYATFTSVLTATTPSSSASLSLPSYTTKATVNSTTDVNILLGMYCTSATNVLLTYDKSLTVTASNASSSIANASAFTISFGGLTCTSGKYLTLPKLTIANPSVAKTIVITASTFYNTTGTVYYIETGTYTITLTANPLNYLTAALTNNSVSASGVSLTLNFSTYSPLANKDSTNLSYYLITLDSSYITTSIQCFDLQLNSIVYCQKHNNQSNVIQIQVGTKPSGTVFLVRIDNLTNPRYMDSATQTAYNVSTYSYSVDGFYQADSGVSYIALTPKTLLPTLTTSNSTVGAKVNITVNLSSDILSGDTLKFSINDSSAYPVVTSSGTGSNVNFTFVSTGGYWQYIATGTLTNVTFRFLRTNPSNVISSEAFPSISIGNGAKMNAQTNGSVLYPATSTPADLLVTASSTLSTTGSYTQTTLNLLFSVPYSSSDVLIITFPSSYCTANFVVAGGNGFQPTLPVIVNGTKVAIILQFNGSFSLGSAYTLTIKYLNSYTTGSFLLDYSTFTNTGLAKETHSGAFTLTAASATVTTSSIQLYNNQTLRVEVQYPFAITDGSNTTLELSTSSSNFNITGCSSLTTGSCTSMAGSNSYQVAGINSSQNSVLLLSCSFGYFTTDSLTILTRVAGKLSTNYSTQLKPLCDVSCWSCDSADSTKCASCFPNGVGPQLPLYSLTAMKCYASCPSGTFTSDSSCLQCDSSCATCSAASACLTCQTDYIKSADTGLCLLNCSGSCKTCQFSKSNCTSCSSSTILYKNQCVQDCPSGTAIDTASNTCLESKLAYLPFLVAAVVMMLLAAGSKLLEPTTDVVTTCVAALGIMEVGCLIALLASSGKSFQQPMLIGIVALVLQLIFNIVGFVLYMLYLRKDEKFQTWQDSSIKNKISLYTLLVLSCLTSFKLFRLVYSRLLGRDYFWAKFESRDVVIPFTNILSGVHLVLFGVLSVVAGGLLLFSQQVKLSTLPQIFLYSIEIIVIEALGVICVLLDVKKHDDYFEERGTKQSTVTNQNEQIQNPTITLQNIISLPNIEEVSEDAMIKSPKMNSGVGLKGRRMVKTDNKSNLTVKKDNNSPICKRLQEKPKSVERNRLGKSPPNKIMSSRVSPGKDKLDNTHRSGGIDGTAIASVPVIVKQSNMDDIVLDVPLSKEGSDGAGPFHNENKDNVNSPDFDRSTVHNRRVKAEESEASKTQLNHTMKLGHDATGKDFSKKSGASNHIEVSGFRRTTEIKLGDRPQVPLPRRPRPQSKINDLFLGFLNNDQQNNIPKSKSKQKARRASRQNQELGQANRTTGGFHPSRYTESDGASASSQFNTRFGALYEFGQDEFSEQGPPSELDKKEEVPKPQETSKDRKKSPKQRSKQRLKKTKDIYLHNQNINFGRRDSSKD